MITAEEQQLIYNLLTNKIDLDKFYSEYPIDLRESIDYFYLNLLDSIARENVEQVEVSLDIIEYLYDEEYINKNIDKVYKQLIDKIWVPYYLLERILDSLEVCKGNIKYYLKILHINKFEEQDTENIETFMVPIWKKCLWNLYKVGINNEILDILKQYFDSPYEELKNTAKTLIQKTEFNPLQ